LLGESFPHCHQVADQARAARLETLQAILALAKREEARAVVIAGNLWADNRVGPALVEEAARLLSRSTVPVFLLPGHRDPMTPDSPYELYADLFKNKVRLLRDNQPVVLKGGLTLLPCPVGRRGPTGDPTRWMPERDREPLRVAVVHTSPEAQRLPPGCQSRRELDFVLAGGRLNRGVEGELTYCGSPEPTDFGQDAGYVSLTDLLANGQSQTRSVKVGKLDWVEQTEPVANAQMLAELTDRWSKDESRATTLLKLTLQGSLNVEGLSQVETTRRTLAAKLLHLDFRNQVTLALDGTIYRHPLLRSLTASLGRQAATQFAYDPVGIPDQAEIAREALTQLLQAVQASAHEELV
jgi:hypothetical protein